jgi:hypothetical protein
MSDASFSSDGKICEGRKPLTPEARRALAEAEERRRKAGPAPERPPEFLGPSGPEPVRYGDWERKGIASDF